MPNDERRPKFPVSWQQPPDEKAAPSVGPVGRLLAGPVVTSLIIMAIWVMVASVLTPNVAADGMIGEMQRELRRTLIGFGLLINGIATAATIAVLVKRSRGRFDAE